jgi:hypothetical protein
VLGAAAGSAVHLALALAVPWRPLDAGWPALAEHGAAGSAVVMVHGPRQVDRAARWALFDAGRDRRLAVREVPGEPGDELASVAEVCWLAGVRRPAALGRRTPRRSRSLGDWVTRRSPRPPGGRWRCAVAVHARLG